MDSLPQAAAPLGTPAEQTCHRHPERRAANVVQAHLVEEMHRVGITAVLTADAQIELWFHSASLFDSYPYQLTNAGLAPAPAG